MLEGGQRKFSNSMVRSMLFFLSLNMKSSFTIVGIAGSLREGSLNKALLKAAQSAAPAESTFTIVSLGDLPLYNQDIEVPLPSAVQAFKTAVQNADALVISTPEYNYSVPGVLKNAIDWLSRPSGQNSLNEKPCAIIGTSPGMLGSARAQYHLRQILVGLNVHVLNKPEIIVPDGGHKFDATGMLTDAKTIEKLKEMLMELAQWTERLRQE